jgi:hypothetical protein
MLTIFLASLRPKTDGPATPGAIFSFKAVNLLRAIHARTDGPTMGLRIAVVARVGEAAVKSTVMLDHFIDATTMVIDFRQSFGVGLHFGAGACLRDGSSGLRCGSRLNRKSWSRHA